MDEKEPETSVHQNELITSRTELLKGEKYSDLIIKCDGQGWRVHKAVMCSTSSVLATACDIEMKEGISGVIDHDTFDAATVGRMIAYVYKRNYSVETEDEVLAASQLPAAYNEEPEVPKGINEVLIAHANAYAIGEYYHIPTLKAFAVERFDAVSRRGLQADGFVDVIKAVWTQTDSGDKKLRSCLRDYAYCHRFKLAHDEAFGHRLADEDGVHAFTVELFQHTVQEQVAMRNRTWSDENREAVIALRKRISAGISQQAEAGAGD
ncbi:hypothetical protein LTR09_004155 [Extremus antarcticus]|uniref:BTB domain-containing protein n=1 Tax=Extremus antarcticus TaxID=702011 RepID=A0AAJ0DR52_9PEZI|nr:hypothetical protein LTR09_004155 [Extremus antarcticus]